MWQCVKCYFRDGNIMLSINHKMLSHPFYPILYKSFGRITRWICVLYLLDTHILCSCICNSCLSIVYWALFSLGWLCQSRYCTVEWKHVVKYVHEHCTILDIHICNSSWYFNNFFVTDIFLIPNIKLFNTKWKGNMNWWLYKIQHIYFKMCFD